jgi:hypothetical protein
MPTENERLAIMETKIVDMQERISRHEDSCEQYKQDIQNVLGDLRVSMAKYSGLSVVVMAGVVAIVQIVIQQLLTK